MTQLESPREQATITVRIDADLKSQYKDAVDSMSGDLRDHIQTVVESETSEKTDEFDDDVLNRGYAALLEKADIHDPDGRQLNVDEAVSAAAEATKVPSKAVKNRILEPLEKRGYLRPAWGFVILYRPEEVR
jgi:antitoxin component of RelBE/YafQ-DinJ toxin-antitoxin module